MLLLLTLGGLVAGSIVGGFGFKKRSKLVTLAECAILLAPVIAHALHLI